MSVAKLMFEQTAEAFGSGAPLPSYALPHERFTLATNGAHLPKTPITVMTLSELLKDRSMPKPSQSQWIALLVSVARVFETRVADGHASELTLDDVTVTNAQWSGTSDPLHVEMTFSSPKRAPVPSRDNWMVIFARFCFQAATQLNWDEISASRNLNALVTDALANAPGIMTAMEEVWRCAQSDSHDRANNEPSRHSSTLLHISPALRVFNTNGFSSSVSVPRPDSIPALVQLLGCEERKEWQVSALVAMERLLSSSVHSESAAMMLCHWIDRIVPRDVTLLDGTRQNRNVCDLSIYITRLNIIASILWELMKRGDLDAFHRMQRRVQSLGIDKHLSVDDIVHFTPIFLKRRHLVVVARLTVSCCFKNTTMCRRFMTPYNVRSIAYKILETSVPMTKDANDQYSTLLAMMLVMSDFGTWCGKDGSLIMHDKSKLMRWWDYMDDDLFVKYALPCFSFDAISDSTCKYITSKLEIIAWNEAIKHADLRHVSTYSGDVLQRLKLQAAKLTNTLSWLTSIAWHSDSQVKAASPRGIDAANRAAVTFQHHAHHYIVASQEDVNSVARKAASNHPPHTLESIMSAVDLLCAASSAAGILYDETQETIALDARSSDSKHHSPPRWRSVTHQRPMATCELQSVPQELRQVDENTHLLFKPAPCEGVTASYASSKYLFSLNEGDIRHGWCSMRHIECNIQTCDHRAEDEESPQRLPPFESVTFRTLSPICKSVNPSSHMGTSGMICFDIDDAGDTCDIVVGIYCETHTRDGDSDGRSDDESAESRASSTNDHASLDIFQWRLATGMISYNGVDIPYASPCTTGSGVAIGIAGRHVYLVKDGMFYPPLRQSPMMKRSRDDGAAAFADNPLFMLPLDAQVHISVTIGCPSVRLGARIMNADWKEDEFASFEDRNPIAYELMHANNAASQCPHQHVRKEWTVKLGGIPVTGNIFPSLTPMQQQLVTLIHRAREKCPGESSCTMSSHFCKPTITLADEINKRF